MNTVQIGAMMATSALRQKKFRDPDKPSDESMATHTSHDDDSSSVYEESEEEEIDPWTTLIEDAASSKETITFQVM